MQGDKPRRDGTLAWNNSCYRRPVRSATIVQPMKMHRRHSDAPAHPMRRHPSRLMEAHRLLRSVVQHEPMRRNTWTKKWKTYRSVRPPRPSKAPSGRMVRAFRDIDLGVSREGAESRKDVMDGSFFSHCRARWSTRRFQPTAVKAALRCTGEVKVSTPSRDDLGMLLIGYHPRQWPTCSLLHSLLLSKSHGALPSHRRCQDAFPRVGANPRYRHLSNPTQAPPVYGVHDSACQALTRRN